MAGAITASESSWTAPFPAADGAAVRISKSAADRTSDHLGPSLALQPRKRLRKDAVLIVDDTLLPTRDRAVAEQSRNYRYSTDHQVVIDADTRLVVAVGRPVSGNRDDKPGGEPVWGGRAEGGRLPAQRDAAGEAYTTAPFTVPREPTATPEGQNGLRPGIRSTWVRARDRLDRSRTSGPLSTLLPV
ncbi:hypothetical protein GCM10018772_24150 [Streptomyces fumanus]|uniref:Transposase n=1 Tax=Streptomyces fumanus TaxID=67302 RepID=A0A919DYN1_9ACTN|nr:hypothetical protein GCM10018772_24150 [Streptomyces fumanus]